MGCESGSFGVAAEDWASGRVSAARFRTLACPAMGSVKSQSPSDALVQANLSRIWRSGRAGASLAGSWISCRSHVCERQTVSDDVFSAERCLGRARMATPCHGLAVKEEWMGGLHLHWLMWLSAVWERRHADVVACRGRCRMGTMMPCADGGEPAGHMNSHDGSWRKKSERASVFCGFVGDGMWLGPSILRRVGVGQPFAAGERAPSPARRSTHPSERPRGRLSLPDSQSLSRAADDSAGPFPPPLPASRVFWR